MQGPVSSRRSSILSRFPGRAAIPRRVPLGVALRRALSHGYDKAALRADVLAGIVALPLSMALAIAVGVLPQHALYTAIVAGQHHEHVHSAATHPVALQRARAWGETAAPAQFQTPASHTA